jgi:hypothetical protein
VILKGRFFTGVRVAALDDKNIDGKASLKDGCSFKFHLMP